MPGPNNQMFMNLNAPSLSDIEFPNNAYLDHQNLSPRLLNKKKFRGGAHIKQSARVKGLLRSSMASLVVSKPRQNFESI
jgi:hypothetical protein